MRVRQIKRTSTLAWSPGQHSPLLAAGTVAGALDLSFSSSTELELFDLNLDELTEHSHGSSEYQIKLGNVKKVGSTTSSAR